MKRTPPSLSFSPLILSSRGLGGSIAGRACLVPHSRRSRDARQPDRDGRGIHGIHGGHGRQDRRNANGYEPLLGQRYARAPTCWCTFPPTSIHPAVRSARPVAGASMTTCRLFHTSRPLWIRASSPLASDQSHYETLNVPVNASTNEIKKSFYKLSKLHHPDHNPSDPHAPRRFMRISEAYSVLSHTDKRAVYDRDVMRLHARGGNNSSSSHHPHHAHTHRANASYHSTGPAGGRPASGLSRRRSQFKGPPPSFFRNTGSGKGQAYTPDSNGKGPTKEQQWQYEQQYGFGPGSVNRDDRGTRSAPHTPYFDRASNERTQRSFTERAAERRATAAATAALGETSTKVGFIIIMAVIVLSVALPALVSGWTSPAPRKKTRAPASAESTA